jgi:hypothetical protein
VKVLRRDGDEPATLDAKTDPEESSSVVDVIDERLIDWSDDVEQVLDR